MSVGGSSGHITGSVSRDILLLRQFYKGNTSVVDILKRGPGAQMRTRYLSISQYFLGDLMHRGEIIITYCKAAVMVADGLKKPLVGKIFRRLRDALVQVTMA
jgi:hypothetical protein